MFEATSVPDEPYNWDGWKQVYAIEAASEESQKSQLPGHFGECRAARAEHQDPGAHEIDGRIRGGQSPDAEEMDRHITSLASGR